ncbi:DUF2163 domain-containing protein [Rhodovulum sp. YNF3179]|uniref:DUF2163 domain-containing protein n=1 Tax=Rhodovulum sp. YNF3179 TaxID=3425127 RepID=UPI003D3354B6
MRDLNAGLAAHLATGATTLCRAWAVTRRDGRVLGFTDHDRDLVFDGVTFRARSGLTASALQQTSGLAVDNAQAVGALSDASVTEDDILAGLYDGAALRIWLVNWTDPAQRQLQFRGSLGEIRRAGGRFEADLRGLAEALNRPQGGVYQRDCAAVLGDARCGFDLDTPGYSGEAVIESLEDGRVLRCTGLDGFAARWFERGRLDVLDGDAAGAGGVVKTDRGDGARREIGLWETIRGALAAGDRVRLRPGCDKRAETCRFKFHNFENFRGFPHIPGDDWLMAYPKPGGPHDGGSRSE